MDVPQFKHQEEADSATLYIKEELTYETVALIISQILKQNVRMIKCVNIKKADTTGIQFLHSVKKYSKDILFEIDLSQELSQLINKTGYKL